MRHEPPGAEHIVQVEGRISPGNLRGIEDGILASVLGSGEDAVKDHMGAERE